VACPGFLPVASRGLAFLYGVKGEFSHAVRLLERALALSRDLNLTLLSPSVAGFLGSVYARSGRVAEGLSLLEQTLKASESIGVGFLHALVVTQLGEASMLAARPEDALAFARRALTLARERGERGFEAGALRLLGEIASHRDPPDVKPAEGHYREALARLPGYVHARAGVARVEAARGRHDRAATLYRRVVDALPLPQYAIALADVLQVSGREDEAKEAYDLVGVIQQLFRANGVRTETETALFDLDHERNVADALARAREAVRLWPSIYTQDVYAWALYKNGRCGEARRASRLALRLSTKDALKIFHRGMIELCLGHRAAGRRFIARALEINPYFSVLYVPVAREALR